MSRRMLIPIDGSRGSSSVIPYATELAKSMGYQVDLLLVQPERHAKLPHPIHHRSADHSGEAGAATVGPPSADKIREANQEFVKRHAEEFDALGLKANSHVRVGKPVEEILQAALELRSDLIAMTTRYRGGSGRPKSRSVAEEIVWRSRLPVLLIAEG